MYSDTLHISFIQWFLRRETVRHLLWTVAFAGSFRSIQKTAFVPLCRRTLESDMAVSAFKLNLCKPVMSEVLSYESLERLRSTQKGYTHTVSISLDATCSKKDEGRRKKGKIINIVQTITYSFSNNTDIKKRRKAVISIGKCFS